LKLIHDYGADAVRVGLMLSSAAGNDLLFDESLCQQGKNFANKIWNAYRLIEGWEINENQAPSEAAQEALVWYENHFQKTLKWVDENFEKYRISDALMSLYKLVWDDFCSWLLELVKPEYGQPIDRETHQNTVRLFENNLRLLHPFMPFITEEIWHFIASRTQEEALIVSEWPKAEPFDVTPIASFDLAREIIAGVRNFRKEKNISFKEGVELYVTKGAKDLPFEASIKKLGVIEKIHFNEPAKELSGGSFRVSAIEFFIPTTTSDDPETERKKMEEELRYMKGFLASVEKKLSNERFVANAPEKVVAMEQKKVADAKEKIALLEKSLLAL
jgi:valyl-tRNA synthetase